MRAETAIETRQITKRFGRRLVLCGVDFALQRGTIAGIMGENGSGKSTLLQIMAGLLRPSSGSVECHCTLGYCPEETQVFETLTVTENLTYFSRAYGISDSVLEKRTSALLDRFRLTKYKDRAGAELSGGSKQKLNLIIALLDEPDLLLLDEPCSGLDWETYLIFWDFAEQMRREGKSIVIVSHVVFEQSHFDDLITLRDGAVSC